MIMFSPSLSLSLHLSLSPSLSLSLSLYFFLSFSNTVDSRYVYEFYSLMPISFKVVSTITILL